MPDTALDDVKVLDLTHYIAGPYCTKLLADYGARVIKVEHPDGGDPARRLGPFPDDLPDPEKSGLFLLLNTNKLGITLNLKTKAGVRILKELVEDVDILVESFRPRVMHSLGLDYNTLRRINPRLVMTSISNFGQTGPYRDYKATEIVLSALGGVMYVSGDYDRGPLKHGPSLSQYMGGLNALLSTLMGLYLQRETGCGQHIDVSLAESVTSTLSSALDQYSYAGAVLRRSPKERSLFGFDLWPAENGHVGMFLLRNSDVPRWGEFLGIPELADPKFSTAEGREQHRAELNDLALGKLEEWDRMEFLRQGRERRLMASAEMKPSEVLAIEEMVARNYFQELEHPHAGRLPYPGEVLGLTETPVSMRSPAPLLGQHNEEVLCQGLGYSREDLVRLKRAGII